MSCPPLDTLACPPATLMLRPIPPLRQPTQCLKTLSPAVPASATSVAIAAPRPSTRPVVGLLLSPHRTALRVPHPILHPALPDDMAVPAATSTAQATPRSTRSQPRQSVQEVTSAVAPTAALRMKISMRALETAFSPPETPTGPPHDLPQSITTPPGITRSLQLITAAMATNTMRPATWPAMT